MRNPNWKFHPKNRIAVMGAASIKKNLALFYGALRRKGFLNQELHSRKPAHVPSEIWRERMTDLLSRDSQSLPFKERQALLGQILWFASMAPSPLDAAMCNEAIQVLQSAVAPKEAIAS